MAENSMTIRELLRKLEASQDIDILKEGVQLLAQELIEADAARFVGADRYERSESRDNYRNGYRERDWATRVGTIQLRIPKTRSGSYFPPFLEARKRSEKALLAVVQQAYVKGVSTRKVDALAQSLGLERLDKSQVSRICKELDDQVQAWKQRPLEDEYAYLWVDATYLKVRQNGRVVSTAVVIAMAVKVDGSREILGFDIGPAESHAFWKEFLRGLVKRGLKGVRLVVSDCHEGLKQAIKMVFADASWQRCRVHFMRNVLGRVPKSHQAMVSGTVRTIFIQPNYAAASELLEEVAVRLQPRFGRVSELLWECREDILAYYAFPSEHWSKLYSTNPLERLNKEIKRRSDVVGIFPDRPSVERLVGALLMEQDDEWSVAKRYLPQRSLRRTNELNEGGGVHYPDQQGILAQR